MTTMPQTRCGLHAAPKAAAGATAPSTGYAGAVEPAHVATAVGDTPVAFSGNIAPISWLTSDWSRNIVAPVVTPAA